MLNVVASVLLLLVAGANEAHQRGLNLYKQRDYTAAIPALEEAAKSEDPKSAEFKESALLIGQSYFTIGRMIQAIPWLEKVTEQNEANYMLGYAYLQNKQQAESEAAFARLFGIKADSAAGHLVAAQMMVKQELEHYAEIEAKKAVAMDAKLPGVHLLLGEIAIYSGRLPEGLAEMSEEISINPGLSTAWYRRGDVYTRQENWQAAIPDLQRAVWLNQNFSGPYILLGKSYFKTANFDNAERILRRALALDPQNASATFLLAQTLLKEGKAEEGRKLLEKVRSMKEEPLK